MKFVILTLTFLAVLITSCNKDCEEPEEPEIPFEPYFASDSLRIWGDFSSIYDVDFIALTLAPEDSSSTRVYLSGSDIVIYPFGEAAQTNGSDFTGSINIVDISGDTTIATIDFESTLEGGDNSNSCINPLIETVKLRQGNRLLYEGPTRPTPKIYLTH